jgi:hypothetical protein
MTLTFDAVLEDFRKKINSKLNFSIAFVDYPEVNKDIFEFYVALPKSEKEQLCTSLTQMFIKARGGKIDIYATPATAFRGHMGKIELHKTPPVSATPYANILFTFSKPFSVISAGNSASVTAEQILLDPQLHRKSDLMFMGKTGENADKHKAYSEALRSMEFRDPHRHYTFKKPTGKGPFKLGMVDLANNMFYPEGSACPSAATSGYQDRTKTLFEGTPHMAPPFRLGKVDLNSNKFYDAAGAAAFPTWAVNGFQDSQDTIFVGAPPSAKKRPPSPTQRDSKAAKVALAEGAMPLSPVDCIALIRARTNGFVNRDCENVGVPFKRTRINIHALPGTPHLRLFCEELERFRQRSNNFRSAPHQVLMLAYHGTDNESCLKIMASGHISPGPRKAWGKGAYFSPRISEAIGYSKQKAEKRTPPGKSIDIIVSVLILDSAMYTWGEVDEKGTPRPKSYIVNSNIAAHLPLMQIQFEIPALLAVNVESHERIKFTQTLDKQRPGCHEYFPGNASTTKRNVGGTKKKNNPKDTTVLYMTLDGKVGEIAIS